MCGMGAKKGQTTIAIFTSTRDRLASIGKKKETYDQIINNLLDEHEKAK